MARCPAGHRLSGPRRPCAACRRDALIRHVIAADASLPASEAAAAVDAVATSPAVLRELASALAADPGMLRRGQAGRRPRRRRAADLRAVPPPRPRAPPVRDMRPDRLDRGAGPRRRAGHLRQLLPAARRRLRRVRQVPGMQLRPQRPSGLPVVLAACHRSLRPLRPGPPAAGPLARGPGLRPVLHRRAAPARLMLWLRRAAAAGGPAWPRGDHLRYLRRA